MEKKENEYRPPTWVPIKCGGCGVPGIEPVESGGESQREE